MNIFLYVLDTLADWEIAYLTAEINTGRYFKKNISPVKIVKVGNNMSGIKTFGGMEIFPDIDVDHIDLHNGDLILLPGADTWLNGNNHKIIDKISENLSNKDITIAAICGATTALADHGMLDTLNHTSNDLEFLKMFCKNYKGEKYYENKPATIDGNLITASGLAPLEFTYEVLKKLNIMETDTLNAWYQLYTTREPRYFYDLMRSLEV
ncbi:MAG: DJ-1/PfpI family protein [Tannerella sp.]|nr:DJ-1/PfpI family protein [Tannerella sp.]